MLNHTARHLDGRQPAPPALGEIDVDLAPRAAGQRVREADVVAGEEVRRR
jgi:hypothetical protein